MAPNTWRAIPGNTLSAINPANDAAINPVMGNAPWRGSNGQPAIIDGWSTACFDEARGRLWIPLGGGHANYAGNEPYRIDLSADAPNWSMVRPPSGSVQFPVGTLDDFQEASGVYSDGRLRSAHTYGNVCYVPGVGPVINRLSALYSRANAQPLTGHAINESSGEAAQVFDLASGGGQYGIPTCGCCYVPANGARPARVYGLGGGSNTAMEYVTVGAVPGTWAVTTFGSTNNYLGGYGALVYIPLFDCVVSFDGQVGVWNLTTGYQGYATISGTAPAWLLNTTQCQPSWCAERGQLLIWNNASSAQLIATLTPGATPLSAWTWGQVTPAGGNAVTPSTATGNGTYARFGYSSRLKGCYLLNGTTQPVYFFATE